MLIERLEKFVQQAVAFDTETYLIRPGNLVPPLVLGSVAWWDGQKIEGALLTKDQTVQLFEEVVRDVNRIMVGANLAFDLAVMAKEFAKRGHDIVPAIFQVLMGDHTENMTGIHDCRVFDIQHAEALHAITSGTLGKDPRTHVQFEGRYSQDRVIQNLFDRDDAKRNDAYRKRYGEFDNVPLDQLPPEAQQYPVDDVVNALQAGFAQVGAMPKVAPRHTFGKDGKCTTCQATSMSQNCWVTQSHTNLHDLGQQTPTAFCAHMGAAHGFRIDQSYVDTIVEHAEGAYKDGIKPYVAAGIVREDGTENRSELKKRIAVTYGSKEPCPVCQGTGKVPSPANPKSKIICFRTGEDGVTREKTCDGTGYVLHPNVPTSEKGGIAYGRANLVESGDPFLMDYAGLLEDMKIRTVYGPFLRTARVCISCGHTGVVTQKFKDDHAPGCAMAGWKDIPLTLRPNPILDTKRMSYDGAVMLLPRKTGYIDARTEQYIPSLRECFVPRPGYVYSSEDFKAGETYTHAQSCRWLLGWSDLGEALLKDIDPHGAVAASVLGVSYQEWVRRKKEPLFKAARQAAKPFTFGKPTGMGSPKLVLGNRAQGPDTPAEHGPSWIDDPDHPGKKIRGYKGTRFCILMTGAKTCGDVMVSTWGKKDTPLNALACKACLECADHLGKVWLNQWSENQPYYDLSQSIVDNGMEITEVMLERWPWLKKVYTPGTWTEPGQIFQHWSGTLRGDCNFTTICNGFFQTLLADIAKLAYRMVCREAWDRTVKVPRMMFPNSIPSKYAGITSPLLGSKPIAPFHDEIFAEHPISMAVDGACRISEIMRDSFRWICPDMADGVGADPTLITRWYKNAEPVYRDAAGNICDPKKTPGAVLSIWYPKFGPCAQ